MATGSFVAGEDLGNSSHPANSRDSIDSKTGLYRAIDACFLSAKENDIPSSFAQMVSHLLLTSTQQLDTGMSSTKSLELNEAINNFVSTQADLLRSKVSYVGISFWLSACIIKSFTRTALTSDQVPEGYIAFVQEAKTSLKESISSTFPKASGIGYQKILDESMNRFADECLTQILTYRNDVLCPSFKSELLARDERAILKELGKLPLAVKLNQGQGEEITVLQFNQICGRVSTSAFFVLLFHTFIKTSDVPLDKSERWGFMLFETASASKLIRKNRMSWPAIVSMWPGDGSSSTTLKNISGQATPR